MVEEQVNFLAEGGEVDAGQILFNRI